MVNYSSKVLDSTFSALADPTRRAILEQLARGDCSVTTLANPFDMSLPAISKHLRVLERAGLLWREKHGRTHRCCLAADRLKEAAAWIARYRRFWKNDWMRLRNIWMNHRRRMAHGHQNTALGHHSPNQKNVRRAPREGLPGVDGPESADALVRTF